MEGLLDIGQRGHLQDENRLEFRGPSLIDFLNLSKSWDELENLS